MKPAEHRRDAQRPTHLRRHAGQQREDTQRPYPPAASCRGAARRHPEAVPTCGVMQGSKGKTPRGRTHLRRHAWEQREDVLVDEVELQLLQGGVTWQTHPVTLQKQHVPRLFSETETSTAITVYACRVLPVIGHRRSPAPHCRLHLLYDSAAHHCSQNRREAVTFQNNI